MRNLVSKPFVLAEQPLLDSLPVAIMIIDQNGSIHYLNSTADTIFGNDCPVPVNITKLSRSFDKNDFLVALNNYKDNPAYIFETTINFDYCKLEGLYQLKMLVHADDHRYFLVSLYPLITTNEPALNKQSSEYALLKKNFKELKQFSRVSAMREISSSLADQLNQPLTAILSYTQAMQRLYQDNASSEEIFDAMERVVINAEHAGQIIRNLRARLNANTLNCQSASINQLIKESIHLTELDSGTLAIKLITHYDPSNTSLLVDSIQFKQVILSVLHNAIDAVMAPSVTNPEICLSTRLNGLRYEITIEDNGPGLSQEAQDRLFEPFFTTKKNGIGIGLSMCHHIIDLHKGSINIVSKTVSKETAEKTNTGTIVTIYLPRNPGTQADE